MPLALTLALACPCLQTVAPGTYYQLSEVCNVRDTNGAHSTGERHTPSRLPRLGCAPLACAGGSPSHSLHTRARAAPTTPHPLGDDSTLLFKTHPASSACYTACAQAEPGQSGQAAFEMRSGLAYLRAVLSRGIGADTCGAVDKYTELSKVRGAGRCNKPASARTCSGRPFHGHAHGLSLFQHTPFSLRCHALHPQVNFDFLASKWSKGP